MSNYDERTLARAVLIQSMFEHEGWREVVEELLADIEQIKHELLTAGGDVVPFLQGRADQCNRMIYLPDTLANVLAQAKAELEEI